MTVGDLVTRALRLAGVIGANRAPSAEEMNGGIDSLNDMLAAWAMDGMDLGLAELNQNDEDLIDTAYVKGIRYNLAVELAAHHGIYNELPNKIIAEADDQKDLIRASLADIDTAQVDPALQWKRGNFDFNSGR